MRIFAEALREIKTSLLKVFLFEETLNAILVFLVVYFISSLFNLGIVLPVIFGVAYLAYAFYRKLRIMPVKAVEANYKELQEKLSTAAEYAAVDNRVVNELKSEVLRNLKKVEESSFLNERKVYLKSVAAIVLCFIILLISPVSIHFFKETFPAIFGEGTVQARLDAPFRVGDEKAKGDAPLAIQNSKDDIYGAPAIAKLGSEELRVMFKPAGSELGTRNVKPPEELQFSEQFPDEIVSVAAESMEERIPKEQQELVRRYFKSVVESGR